MKEDLTELFERLETEGVSVMPEIYALTSPHLFGIVTNLIPDAASARDVLKSVYARVWNQRHILKKRHKGDPLNYMRRLAHRTAMDYRFEINSQSELKSDLANIADLDGTKAADLGVSNQDMRILRLAYLKGATVSDISDYENLNSKQVKASLKKTVTRLRGDVS